MYQKKIKSGTWNHHLDSYLGAAASISLAITIYRTLSSRKKSSDDEAMTAIDSYRTRTASGGSAECTQICNGNSVTGCNVESHFWGRILLNLWMCSVKRKSRREASSANACQSATITDLRELQASCHCGSIGIALKVPATVMPSMDRFGKYAFPYFTVSPQHLQIQRGERYLSLYYDNTQRHIEAYGFCRNCGVHLFRAFEDKDKGIEVNFNTIDSVLSPTVNEVQSQPTLLKTDPWNPMRMQGSVDMDEEHDCCRKLDTHPCTPSTIRSSSAGSQELSSIHMGCALSTDEQSLYTMSSPPSINCNDNDVERDFDKSLTRALHNDGDSSMKGTIPKAKSLLPTNIPKITSSQSSIDQMKKYMEKYLSG